MTPLAVAICPDLSQHDPHIFVDGRDYILPDEGIMTQCLGRPSDERPRGTFKGIVD